MNDVLKASELSGDDRANSLLTEASETRVPFRAEKRKRPRRPPIPGSFARASFLKKPLLPLTSPGACLISDSFAVVVVEGGAKGVRRYEKLMLRRIDWNAPADDEDPEDAEDAGGGARGGRNACRCVWKGAVPAPAFRGKL